MSTEVLSRRHRHTRSAAIPPPPPASSQNPQNPHHLNNQLHTRNNQINMDTKKAVQSHQPSTPPKTPRRNANQQAAQNNVNSGAHENGSKQRSRNKNRPKNVMTSPAVARNNRTTPPLTGAQSAGIPFTKPTNTPATVAAAYAGPTFHASPAPSALPIPSFYSKSVPDSPSIRQMFKDKQTPSPAPTPPTEKASYNDSPLDIFFNADRAEKERARSAISAKIVNGPFQPPAASSRISQTPPAPRSQNKAQNSQSKRISGSGIFTMEELDGETESGSPFGPAFSTPYSERINAARSGNQSSKSSQNTDALKAYLFSDALPSPAPTNASSAARSPYINTTGHQQMPSNGPRSAGLPQRPQQNNHFSPDPRTMLRPAVRSGLRQEVTPTKTPTRTPDRSNGQNFPVQNGSSENNAFNALLRGDNKPKLSDSTVLTAEAGSDLKGMEDALRKILRLDAGSGVGASPTRPSLGTFPTFCFV